MSTQDAISKLLGQCAEDKDTQESPRGSNRGPRVEAMLRNTGLGGGYPWCAAAVATWGIEALGADWPVPHTADCDAILSWARRRGCLKRTDPKQGDIFLVLKTDSDAIHTGIVIRGLANGQIFTWEGNTNDDGSREGYRVCQRRRSTSNLVYVRWADELHLPEGAPQPRAKETPAYRVWVSPHGEFPKVQMRSGRPCAPVRELVAAILGSSLENTADLVGWLPEHSIATVRGAALSGTYLQTDNVSRASAWAPVREIAEALGCVVSVGGEMVTIGHARSERNPL